MRIKKGKTYQIGVSDAFVGLVKVMKVGIKTLQVEIINAYGICYPKLDAFEPGDTIKVFKKNIFELNFMPLNTGILSNVPFLPLRNRYWKKELTNSDWLPF